MSEIDLLYFGITGIFLHLFRFDKLSQLEQSYLISPLESWGVHQYPIWLSVYIPCVAPIRKSLIYQSCLSEYLIFDKAKVVAPP